LGLPAIYNPEITYEFTPTGNGQSGTLYAEVSGLGLPPYFLYGAETNPPPGSGQPFLANWWFNGRHGQIKMSTDFPVIAFGTPDEILYTSKASLVGRLIGGNTYSNFSTLSLRGVYQSAQMIVTVNP
jgi:hypothetical protein